MVITSLENPQIHVATHTEVVKAYHLDGRNQIRHIDVVWAV